LTPEDCKREASDFLLLLQNEKSFLLDAMLFLDAEERVSCLFYFSLDLR
jgi:hypothetical protein